MNETGGNEHEENGGMETAIAVVNGVDGLTPDMLRKKWYGEMQGPLHGPWPRPDAATERILNDILADLFADMPGDEP